MLFLKTIKLKLISINIDTVNIITPFINITSVLLYNRDVSPFITDAILRYENGNRCAAPPNKPFDVNK